MSATPEHRGCPNPSRPEWTTLKNRGRQEVVYWREPVEIENPSGYGRQTIHKRVWSRLGLACLDCGLYTPDAPAPPRADDGRPSAIANGIPAAISPPVDQLAGTSVDQVPRNLPGQPANGSTDLALSASDVALR